MNIGQNILNLRKSAKLSQEQLAEILEISPRHYQRIEANYKNTKIKTLIKIIEILDIDEQDILKMFKPQK